MTPDPMKNVNNITENTVESESGGIANASLNGCRKIP
jgi:hypothetical protein